MLPRVRFLKSPFHPELYLPTYCNYLNREELEGLINAKNLVSQK